MIFIILLKFYRVRFFSIMTAKKKSKLNCVNRITLYMCYVCVWMEHTVRLVVIDSRERCKCMRWDELRWDDFIQISENFRREKQFCQWIIILFLHCTHTLSSINRVHLTRIIVAFNQCTSIMWWNSILGSEKHTKKQQLQHTFEK